MTSIKYLRPQSTVMISDAGVRKDKVALATGTTNDVLLGLTVSYSDGSGEELIGIQLSDRQLEQLKQDIVLHQKSQNKAGQSCPQINSNSNEPKPTPFTYSGITITNQQPSQQKNFNPFALASFKLELDPKLVVIKNLGDFIQASVSFPMLGILALGTSAPKELAVLSRTEPEARKELNRKFQELVYSVVIKHG